MWIRHSTAALFPGTNEGLLHSGRQSFAFCSLRLALCPFHSARLGPNPLGTWPPALSLGSARIPASFLAFVIPPVWPAAGSPLPAAGFFAGAHVFTVMQTGPTHPPVPSSSASSGPAPSTTSAPAWSPSSSATSPPSFPPVALRCSSSHCAGSTQTGLSGVGPSLSAPRYLDRLATSF